MSEQPLNLKRAARMVQRQWKIVLLAVVVGFLAGAGYSLLKPPMVTSSAIVVVSPANHQTRTQVLIASSDPVLANTLRRIDPQMTVRELRSRIHVKSMAYNVFSISAAGTTGNQAAGTANAVASSYVSYLGSGRLPGGAVQARILQPAREATGMPLPVSVLITAAIGGLAGLLAGGVTALAISASDRRMRERDEMAASIGVPVLASIPVRSPTDAKGWTKLLGQYEPETVDAWHLRKVLQRLGADPGPADSKGCNSSLEVVSLSHDRRALALGPQLAVFAASLGISTALEIAGHQDGKSTAGLRAACAALPTSSKRLTKLRVTVNEHDGASGFPDAALAVVVTVVDRRSAQFAQTPHPTATVVGISPGAVTAEQLARVADLATAAGHPIAGILVADSDSADLTTGRFSWPAWRMGPGMPTRSSGAESETTG